VVLAPVWVVLLGPTTEAQVDKFPCGLARTWCLDKSAVVELRKDALLVVTKTLDRLQ